MDDRSTTPLSGHALEDGEVDQPPWRRGWSVRVALIPLALVLIGVGALFVQRALSEGDSASPGLAHPVPNTPRALTVALLDHVPTGVAVVWSTAEGGLPDDDTTDDTAAESLKHMLYSSVMLRQGDREVTVDLVVGQSVPLPPLVEDGVEKHDQQGRTISLMVFGESGVVLEIAERPTDHPLPLSKADLHALLDDPRVGTQTDARTLARSAHIPSFRLRPTVDWGTSH